MRKIFRGRTVQRPQNTTPKGFGGLVGRFDGLMNEVTPLTHMHISEAQHKTAGEFVDLVASKLGSGRAVHPETAIASAARLAGTCSFVHSTRRFPARGQVTFAFPTKPTKKVHGSSVSWRRCWRMPLWTRFRQQAGLATALQKNCCATGSGKKSQLYSHLNEEL